MPEFTAYFLKFNSPLHLGEEGVGVEKVSLIAHSDTLWSALTNAWVKLYETLNDWGGFFNSAPPFILSSAFSYIENELFFPKPFLMPFKKEIKESVDDPEFSKYLKKWKKSKVIPESIFRKILEGKPIGKDELFENYDKQLKLKNFVQEIVNPRVNIGPIAEESRLYFVGETHFSENAGLFFLVDFKKDVKEKFEKVLSFLGEEGLGGRRSKGYGYFILRKIEKISFPSFQNPEYFVTLSMVNDKDILPYLKNSFYAITERKGWAFSPVTKEQSRWKPVLMFIEGSVFPQKVKGRILDVTPEEWKNKNHHSVYRNGLAFLLPLKGENYET